MGGVGEVEVFWGGGIAPWCSHGQRLAVGRAWGAAGEFWGAPQGAGLCWEPALSPEPLGLCGWGRAQHSSCSLKNPKSVSGSPWCSPARSWGPSACPPLPSSAVKCQEMAVVGAGQRDSGPDGSQSYGLEKGLVVGNPGECLVCLGSWRYLWSDLGIEHPERSRNVKIFCFPLWEQGWGHPSPPHPTLLNPPLSSPRCLCMQRLKLLQQTPREAA